MGTVPMGTGEASMMAARMTSMSPPVERSITVSEPRWTAVCSFSSSSSILLVTAELPMLALILQALATPMHIGSRRLARWTLLAGMTIRPRATSSRMSSGARSSRWATYCMASVISPARAYSSCVEQGLDMAVRASGFVGSDDGRRADAQADGSLPGRALSRTVRRVWCQHAGNRPRTPLATPERIVADAGVAGHDEGQGGHDGRTGVPETTGQEAERPGSVADLRRLAGGAGARGRRAGGAHQTGGQGRGR